MAKPSKLQILLAGTGARDLISGLTVGLFAVPQAIAYAMIAGLPPVYGIYTAIISTILGALFGHSRHLVTGPTNGICLITYAVVFRYAAFDTASVVFLLTMISGLTRILVALLRLDRLLDFISNSVLVGLATGAALLIAVGQLPNLLALDLRVPPSFVGKLAMVAAHAREAHLASLAVGLATLLVIIPAGRIWKHGAALFAILAATAATWALGLEVQTVGDLQRLTGALPALRLPAPEVLRGLNDWGGLILSGVAIGLYGLIEATTAADLVAKRSGQRMDTRRECLAQGLTNVISAFFQCFPSSGSFTRSFLLFLCGGRTRLAIVISGLAVLAFVRLLAPLANAIPVPALAGMLLYVAARLIEPARIRAYLTHNRRGFLIFAATVLTALLVRLDVAILVGVGVSILVFLQRAQLVRLTAITPQGPDTFVQRDVAAVARTDMWPVQGLQLEGALFFGAATRVEEDLIQAFHRLPARVYVLRLKHVYSADFTGMEALLNFVRFAQSQGREVILAGVREDLRRPLAGVGLPTLLGPQGLFFADEEMWGATTRAYAEAERRLGPVWDAPPPTPPPNGGPRA